MKQIDVADQSFVLINCFSQVFLQDFVSSTRQRVGCFENTSGKQADVKSKYIRQKRVSRQNLRHIQSTTSDLNANSIVNKSIIKLENQVR